MVRTGDLFFFPPEFDEFFEEPTAQAAAPASIGESSGSIGVLFVGTGTRVGGSIH